MTDTTQEWVQIERTFAAPIDTIWQLWTDAEQFKNGTARRAHPYQLPIWMCKSGGNG